MKLETGATKVRNRASVPSQTPEIGHSPRKLYVRDLLQMESSLWS